jgi:hypothetical protein
MSENEIYYDLPTDCCVYKIHPKIEIIIKGDEENQIVWDVVSKETFGSGGFEYIPPSKFLKALGEYIEGGVL